MDLESLNHRLRWNVSSTRGYERLIDLVIARVARVVIPFSASTVGVTRSAGAPRAALRSHDCSVVPPMMDGSMPGLTLPLREGPA
jgi:hypothetical protein